MRSSNVLTSLMILSSSSEAKSLGMSPPFRIVLISSKKASHTNCESFIKKTVGTALPGFDPPPVAFTFNVRVLRPDLPRVLFV
ncbi:hypothetical protein PR003_g7122 [Phytophthora rubi]|uniref:Uncharacterized protein n=1 Tax=Phytophthora rubi TaxID=129364 RepID=A0A6A3NJX1_9STRA|nr:hypothetical protein PR002_g7092 [Phytophthora rubi]KAE9040691.1 hypothetical protein PR001_g6957 [Phytophthora rubi]KAE9347053.1 hypothetical protein PR003_g7122 [Phytophthora rubi]